MHSDGWLTKFCRLDFTFLIFMLKDFFMPIKKLSIYVISEEWPQEELNTNFQFASTAKKNTLPYEGGGSFLIFKCHLKIFLTHFSYLFSCKSISAAWEKHGCLVPRWQEKILLGGAKKLKRGREKGRNPTAERKRDRCTLTHRSGKAKKTNYMQ